MDPEQSLNSPDPSAARPPSPHHDRFPNPKFQDAPSSPVRIHTPSIEVQEPSSATIENGTIRMRGACEADRGGWADPPASKRDGSSSPATTGEDDDGTRSDSPVRRPKSALSPAKSQTHIQSISPPTIESDSDFGIVKIVPTPEIHLDSINGEISAPEQQPQLQYHHMLVEEEDEKRKKAAEEEKRQKKMAEDEEKRKKSMQRSSQATIATLHSSSSDGHTASSGGDHSQSPGTRPGSRISRMIARPGSTHSLGAELRPRGRSSTPSGLRNSSVYGSPADARPTSTIDLLNIPYAQQMAHQLHTLEHAKLQAAVGANASLLDTRKTLEMYRANVKKTTDLRVQYEFALLLINAAQEAANRVQGTSPNLQGEDGLSTAKDRKELLKEARSILQRLADRGYAFAQYYLADGYSSGLFNDGKEEPDRAFPFFVAAGKHGHAEAAYRTALCYEFGWGSRRDPAKAAQFHRQAASRGHPGAAVRLGKACLTGDMGLGGRDREGVKWLKRATEGANAQHNSAPYELGLLHVTGYGADVFKDEAYTAQLFTQAAELGHPEANLRMGAAYEHGLLNCPRDPALSIHFYHGAAQAGLPAAMMALCAWYMVGAEPVLRKDEGEAYEWAKRAAQTGYPKAEYAVGYFTEMGVGCRRDPLEANVWYVRAADAGDERARQRLAIIREAESGVGGGKATGGGAGNGKNGKNSKKADGAGLRPDHARGRSTGSGSGSGSGRGRETLKKKRSLLNLGGSSSVNGGGGGGGSDAGDRDRRGGAGEGGEDKKTEAGAAEGAAAKDKDKDKEDEKCSVM